MTFMDFSKQQFSMYDVFLIVLSPLCSSREGLSAGNCSATAARESEAAAVF